MGTQTDGDRGTGRWWGGLACEAKILLLQRQQQANFALCVPAGVPGVHWARGGGIAGEAMGRCCGRYGPPAIAAAQIWGMSDINF